MTISAGGIPRRQIVIWLLLLILAGMILGLERAGRDRGGPRLDSHGHVISETRMLLPMSLQQIGAVEIAYDGVLHRFERDQAGIWFDHTHATHDSNSDEQHSHRADVESAQRIGDVLAAFARTRIERQFTLNEHTQEYGVVKPDLIVMVYRPGDIQPAARYAVGHIAPDGFSRYVMVTGSFAVVTIANYQIDHLLTLIGVGDGVSG
jgi:hypothetical protein